MSKVGKKIIKIPEKIFILLTPQATNFFCLNSTGPLGFVLIKITSKFSLFCKLMTFTWVRSNIQLIKYNLQFKNIRKVNVLNFWGLFNKLLFNSILGLSQGFLIQLKILGLGYKTFQIKKYLLLLLGYSHGIEYKIPGHIDILCIKPTLVSIFGISKSEVTNFANNIKNFRIPENYKGKGIRFITEQLTLKEGKKKT